MKRANWLRFNPRPTTSWSLWKICKIRDIMSNWMVKDRYSIASIYKEYTLQQAPVAWAKFAWHRPSITKERFIFWLAFQNKLKTRDKLKKIGLPDDDSCPMCASAVKTLEHTFFNCVFSSQCLAALSHWLGVPLQNSNLVRLAQKKWNASGFKRKVIITSLCYHIWKARNDAIWGST
ncbi:uncharacterized protein LOC130813608 [Amaranthus tricolor]|uniref:uncharacterized protein LOC130813608 n=1 Tax=Amaranthus tricolor TaxID=29722 RepID=UPI00258C3B9F|nr:uncharacterized protein LOC130813608 [Amaranthus tricolor]